MHPWVTRSPEDPSVERETWVYNDYNHDPTRVTVPGTGVVRFEVVVRLFSDLGISVWTDVSPCERKRGSENLGEAPRERTGSVPMKIVQVS